MAGQNHLERDKACRSGKRAKVGAQGLQAVGVVAN
jgi:hypothetical protein